MKGLDPFLVHCSCDLLRCLYVLYGVSRAHYPHVSALENFSSLGLILELLTLFDSSSF